MGGASRSRVRGPPGPTARPGPCPPAGAGRQTELWPRVRLPRAGASDEDFDRVALGAQSLDRLVLVVSGGLDCHAVWRECGGVGRDSPRDRVLQLFFERDQPAGRWRSSINWAPSAVTNATAGVEDGAHVGGEAGSIRGAVVLAAAGDELTQDLDPLTRITRVLGRRLSRTVEQPQAGPR
jgi:hypothetical protein